MTWHESFDKQFILNIIMQNKSFAPRLPSMKNHPKFKFYFINQITLIGFNMSLGIFQGDCSKLLFLASPRKVIAAQVSTQPNTRLSSGYSPRIDMALFALFIPPQTHYLLCLDNALSSQFDPARFDVL